MVTTQRTILWPGQKIGATVQYVQIHPLPRTLNQNLKAAGSGPSFCFFWNLRGSVACFSFECFAKGVVIILPPCFSTSEAPRVIVHPPCLQQRISSEGEVEVGIHYLLLSWATVDSSTAQYCAIAVNNKPVPESFQPTIDSRLSNFRLQGWNGV
jgi:hypothetical protein